ncbi:ABC transporter ATP-binding protein [Salinicola aestuarinus]|uniref:ABC transporter ATP-binding protein n=1 Tax=Salinicola aestuarinus TaxID=1949082 RepID=UPI000DA22362|nr:ABC transporter ATP-binding protein [Salinicola aestuarinus]
MSSHPLLEVERLSVSFPVTGPGLKGLFLKQKLHAVNAVSLQVEPGSVVGLVGESGSGKSTLGRAMLKLEPSCAGSITFDGLQLDNATQSDIARLRQQTAMIFQDPYSSLNPRQTLGEAIAEVLKVHRKCSAEKRASRVDELLTLTGLSGDYKSRYPKQLSGGQCQRAAIARALAIEPRLIVADECVAALDVSIQAQIVNLLLELQRKINLTLLFIAHDLSIVRRLCDRVAVMYLGRIVEEGPTESVFSHPRHPYTAALISAIPDIDPERRLPDTLLRGEPPSPLDLPDGCAFHTRCCFAREACRKGEAPELRGDGNHQYACLLEAGEAERLTDPMR